MQNKLTDPVTLTFEPQNSTISRVSQGHTLYQVQILWDHSFLSYAAHKQTDSKILPMPTDIVSVGNYYYKSNTFIHLLQIFIQLYKFNNTA